MGWWRQFAGSNCAIKALHLLNSWNPVKVSRGCQAPLRTLGSTAAPSREHLFAYVACLKLSVAVRLPTSVFQILSINL